MHRYGHAIVAEISSHRQAFDAPPDTQTVAGIVHAPCLIDRRGQLQQKSLSCGAFDLLWGVNKMLAKTLKNNDLGFFYTIEQEN